MNEIKPAGEPALNQCDGCRSQMPVSFGLHYNEKGEGHMACTKNRYKTKPVPVYIEVEAEVRYWEDATVNGIEDVGGSLIPLRDGKLWKPVIRLADGKIMNWPEGTTADIHYKVCDRGEYWILDDGGRRIMKYDGAYVPNKFLCHGDMGYGDYIIFKVGSDGKIVDWRAPEVNRDMWSEVIPFTSAAP